MKKPICKNQYCFKCKKFDSADNSEIKTPRNCITYLGGNNSKCKKRKKIDNLLKKYFPIINKKVDIYDEIEAIIVQKEYLIPYDEEFIYYSVRIPICSKESEITRSKEVWRCYTSDEAEKVKNVLNEFDYYWIPINTKGKVFIEKVYL
jgi:hypothetical protein